MYLHGNGIWKFKLVPSWASSFSVVIVPIHWTSMSRYCHIRCRWKNKENETENSCNSILDSTRFKNFLLCYVIVWNSVAAQVLKWNKNVFAPWAYEKWKKVSTIIFIIFLGSIIWLANQHLRRVCETLLWWIRICTWNISNAWKLWITDYSIFQQPRHQLNIFLVEITKILLLFFTFLYVFYIAKTD